MLGMNNDIICEITNLGKQPIGIHVCMYQKNIIPIDCILGQASAKILFGKNYSPQRTFGISIKILNY